MEAGEVASMEVSIQMSMVILVGTKAWDLDMITMIMTLKVSSSMRSWNPYIPNTEENLMNTVEALVDMWEVRENTKKPKENMMEDREKMKGAARSHFDLLQSDQASMTLTIPGDGRATMAEEIHTKALKASRLSQMFNSLVWPNHHLTIMRPLVSTRPLHKASKNIRHLCSTDQTDMFRRINMASKLMRIKTHPDKLKKFCVSPEEEADIDAAAAAVGQAADVLKDPEQVSIERYRIFYTLTYCTASIV